jgi:hypothetical protein
VQSYKQDIYNKKIIKNTQPILCKIIKLDCGSSSGFSPKCNIIYNNKTYKDILLKNCMKNNIGINKIDFYYDKENDKVINRTYNVSYFKINFFVFFILSLFLWSIPKKNFLKSSPPAAERILSCGSK